MLYKNCFRKIKKSLGRYLSILIIIMLGVGFLSGIKQSVPDIHESFAKYFKQQNLMDIKVSGNRGITKEDAKKIRQLAQVKEVFLGKSLDVLSQDKAIRIYAGDDRVNVPKLINGRLPQNDLECLADNREYKLGDSITVSEEAKKLLKNSRYEVVGTVESPMYLSYDYGNTTVGNGKLTSFIFINGENFYTDYYSDLYVTVNFPSKEQPFYVAYQNRIQEVMDEIQKIQPQQDGVEWYITDRREIPGFSDISLATDAIKSISDVMPVFFILIVALMTCNTMARMIVEERSEMETLLSLGYSSRSVMGTYLFYVLSASILGSVAGYFLGCWILPSIIYTTFQYILPPLILQYNLVVLAVIVLGAVLLMSVVTVFFCYMELRHKPSVLMRPVPPAQGQKILLERVNVLWKHFSFTWKVTVRNIFRYKQRVLMTVAGVAGGTALLLTGFGLRDGINGVVEKQYQDIFNYQTILTLNGEVTEINQSIKDILYEENITHPALIRQESYRVKNDAKSLNIYMVIPQDKKTFQDYFKLKNFQSDTDIELNNDGVVITQKLAEAFHIKKGDFIQLTSSDNQQYSFPVSDVAKNYIDNYVYITQNKYKDIIKKDLKFNGIVADYSGDNKKMTENLISSNQFLNVTLREDILKKAQDSNKGLNNVVVLIVIIILFLVLIILYNLTSINISERKREIATLKVLGFYDREANQYIYREVFLLTVAAIIIGLIVGTFFQNYVIGFIEGDKNVYFRHIKIISYVWSTLIILIFSGVMQIITYSKMKDIDMIESLKSVE